MPPACEQAIWSWWRSQVPSQWLPMISPTSKPASKWPQQRTVSFSGTSVSFLSCLLDENIQLWMWFIPVSLIGQLRVLCPIHLIVCPLSAAVYDLKSGVSDRNCIYLNNIQVDIMDYIVPATCTDLEFRKMWVEFEWENKVKSLKKGIDLNVYDGHLYISAGCYQYNDDGFADVSQLPD